jgi:hypothetical protein
VVATAIPTGSPTGEDEDESAALDVIAGLVTRLEKRHDQQATEARQMNDRVRTTRQRLDSAKATLRALQEESGMLVEGNRPRRLNMPTNPHAVADE